MDSALPPRRSSFQFFTERQTGASAEPVRRPPSSAVRSSESRHFFRKSIDSHPPKWQNPRLVTPPLEPSTRRTSSAIWAPDFSSQDKDRLYVAYNTHKPHSHSPKSPHHSSFDKNLGRLHARRRSRRSISAGCANRRSQNRLHTCEHNDCIA